jgi:4-amino-4-deoxy-L-arabinose transferase-like glycosyltransferase
MPPVPRPRIASTAAILVLLLTVAVRLFLIWRQHDPPLQEDAVAYDTLGRHLATGQGYTFPPSLLYPWQQAAGKNLPTTRRSPLYPVMLSIGYRLGLGHDGIRVFQAFLAALTLWLVYRIALEVGVSERAAILAMLPMVFYPAFLTSTLNLITEALFLPCVAASALWFLKGLRTSHRRDFILSGIALGLASLTRPITFLLPLALLPFAFRSRRAITGWFLVVLLMAVTVSPWVIRNYRVFGEFEPTFSHSGFNFYMGTQDLELETPIEPALQDSMWGHEEIPLDHWFARQGMARIRRDPLHYARLMGIKAFEAWFIVVRVPRWRVTPKSLIGNGIGLLLTIAGFVLLARSRLRLRWFPLTLALYFLAMLMVSVSGLRFSLPLLLFDSIAIGVALDRLMGGASGSGPSPA